MPEPLSATADAKPCRLIAGSVSMAVGTVIQCRTHERALHPPDGPAFDSLGTMPYPLSNGLYNGIHLLIRTMA